MSEIQQVIWLIINLIVIFVCAENPNSKELALFADGTFFCIAMWYVAELFSMIISSIRKKAKKR